MQNPVVLTKDGIYYFYRIPDSNRIKFGAHELFKVNYVGAHSIICEGIACGRSKGRFELFVKDLPFVRACSKAGSS